MADAPSLACCTPLAEAPLDADSAATLASAFKALADPVRLQLLSIVASCGEACACDLPALVDRSQATVSHHLSTLVDAGLLHREQRGKWAWFTVETTQLDTLRAILAQ